MRTFIVKLLRCRPGQIALLGAIVVTVAVSVGWTTNPQARFKLGGAWVGELQGIQWTAVHAPMDASGKTAVGRLQWVSLNADMLALAASFGADRISEASGTFEMINKDTAKYTLVWYALASGNGSAVPPVGDVVKTINVIEGTWHYTAEDSAESQETYSVYLATGHPLFPAPGDKPVVSMTFPPHPQYRLPMP